MSLLTELFGTNVADIKLAEFKETLFGNKNLTDKQRSQLLNEYGKITGTGLSTTDFKEISGAKAKPKTKKSNKARGPLGRFRRRGN